MNYPKLFSILLITAFIPLGMQARDHKIPLDHSVYDDWKNVGRQQFSPSGNWVSYEINPQVGDGWLYFYNTQNQQLDSVVQGRNAIFSPGSEYVAYRILPPHAHVRQARAQGTSRRDMPANAAEVRNLADGSMVSFENVESMAVARESSPWMVIHKGENNSQTDLHKALVIFNPLVGTRHSFPNVENFEMSEDGGLILFAQRENSETAPTRLRIFDTRSHQVHELFEGQGSAVALKTDHKNNKAAFVFAFEEDNTNHLMMWDGEASPARLLVTETSLGMPENWSIGSHTALSFSPNGKNLFFGTAPIPPAQPEDTLMDSEKHRVDVWHYRDPLIQPMQLVELQQERRRSYAAVYLLEENRMVQLANETMPDVTTSQSGNGPIALGESQLPYLIPNSFESGDYRDVYLVNIHTGESELILEKHRGSVHRSTTGDPRISPGGQFLLYYDQEAREWLSMSLETRKVVNLTRDIHHAIHDELHDAPSNPDPYGIAGWTEDDGHVLIYDQYDIWMADPHGREAQICITGEYGRTNQIRFRLLRLDPSANQVGTRETIMLSAFNTKNKQSGFYSLTMGRQRSPQHITMEDVRYHSPQKAQNADLLLWQKSTFETYPDLWISDLRFGNASQISNTNPQQELYRWGTSQLVEWVSFTGDSLQGVLYLPENMDPNQKYPMLVYFYERSSDGLHTHQTPSPSRSTINRSYCVSNDYIVFMPDIPYTIGYPGQSAYDAIVSGTKAMINQFDFIDHNRMGLQGQSWGGFQIAWLITRTDMFRAAMAGAPVSNMISAYGGIRWSTGMSRIYQYEQTQSRIGGTIWEETLKYMENSPVLSANRVNTPLLMMHNDADGAVPWYQGIEYFMALRRLDKPVWMLNYNDEAHNLTRRPNMMDLSVRMYQFFDHYLKDEPAPRWMTEGVPALLKGVDDRYGVVE